MNPRRLVVAVGFFICACSGPRNATDEPPLNSNDVVVAQPVAPAIKPATPAPVETRPRVIFETPSGEVPFLVEVARTEEERRTGLMHRRHLEPGHGMLFLMEAEEQQVFWMKNTLIPLDIIFVNEALEVIGWVDNAVPLDETPRGVRGASRWVVEIPGGHARLSGITVGSRMKVVDVAGFPPPSGRPPRTAP